MPKLQQEHLETLRREISSYINENDIHIRTKDNTMIPAFLFIDDLMTYIQKNLTEK